MKIANLKPYIILLCKIFLLGLVLQFFLQTFITFQLGRDGTFRSLVRMRKEFILLVLLIAIGYACFQQLPQFLKKLKKSEEKNTRSAFWKFFKKQALLQYLLALTVTSLIFLLIAVLIQQLSLWTFLLSFKYDLLPFFILGIWACLGVLFFTEEDQELIVRYQKIMLRCLYGGLLRRMLVYFMPNGLKFFWYDNFIFEGTIGTKPPAAYYTLINPNLPGSIVRNQFLFERPISFGFWLIAFFPLFALTYLRKLKIKNQILFLGIFGLLVLSTRSRAAIAVRIVQAFTIFLILYRKHLKKWLRALIILFVWGIGGIAAFGSKYLAREHSNTGHLMLVVEGWNLVKHHVVTGRWAGYSGPASHQICYTPEAIDIFAESHHHPDPRCQQIREVNTKHQIATYGYNPENQYLQIIMEYGIIGLLFRLVLLLGVLGYTGYLIYYYRKTKKSAKQTFIYYSLLGLGIWLLGLCAEGMLLHSLVDRMIVYPFFLLYGITLGIRQNIKDIPYIEPTVEKKKKGKKKSKKKK